MEDITVLNVRNSEINVAKDKRIFLTYPANGLVSCTLEETEDSVNFIFNTQDLDKGETILKKTKQEQYRFLINSAELETLENEYDFSLSLKNLMNDINLIPHVLIRDAKKSGSHEFIDRYKALIGSIIQRKYDYTDYLNGGSDLYKKNKLLNEITAMETVEDIKNRLMKEYKQLIRDIEENQRLVPKRNVWMSRLAIPVLGVFLITAGFFGGRMFLLDIPLRDNVIIASKAYINGDVLTVQQALRNYDITELSSETRHILSRSYVSTEALSHSQIDNILVGLTRMTDPIIFDYWILLGRLRFEEAIDIALRLGDNELLLFSYLKYEVYVRNDITIPGEERMELLNRIETNINNLNRARDEAARTALTAGIESYES